MTETEEDYKTFAKDMKQFRMETSSIITSVVEGIDSIRPHFLGRKGVTGRILKRRHEKG